MDPWPSHWLLLRGLAREAEHWHDFPQVFAARLGLEASAIRCLDLPGLGAERRETAPASVAGTLEVVRAKWYATVPAGSSWGLLAISYGAMVAIEWAKRYPRGPSLVVALNPSCRATAAPHLRLRPLAALRALRLGMIRDLEHRERLVLEISSRLTNQRRRDTLLAERVTIARRHPISPTTVLRQLWAAARWASPASLEAPLQIQVSMGDRMVAPICGERLASRLSAACVRHPWAGHDLTFDDPGWCADQAAGWLDELDRRV